MKVLVTNDDGIDAPGLWAVVRELHQIAEVIVVAPKQEQSGRGSSITLGYCIKVNKVESELNGLEAYTTEGTPADCVIVSIRSLFPGSIDLVVSGINKGPNIGHDIFVSGTVGAALQGYLRGIPSLAVSVSAYEDLNFDAAARLAGLLTAKMKNRDLPQDIFLNINLPNLPQEEILGIEITRLSGQSYCDVVEKEEDCEEPCYNIKRNNKDKDPYYATPGTDIWALQLNKVSVTPLLDNSGDKGIKADLQSLMPTIYGELRDLLTK